MGRRIGSTGATPGKANDQNRVWQWTITYKECPEWEWVRLVNTGVPINPVTSQNGEAPWKITFNSECGEVTEDTSGGPGDASGSGRVGVADVGGVRTTGVEIFPETAEVNQGIAPTFTAPPESGNWTSEFALVDPNGDPRPQGGVRWTSDGPGLAAGAGYEHTFSMFGQADLRYALFAFDAEHGTYWEFPTNDSAVVARAASVRAHAGPGLLPISLDMLARGDRSGSGFDDQIIGVRPGTEPRLAGIRRIDIDLNGRAVLVDPGAVTVSDTANTYPPDLVTLQNDGGTLVVEYFGPVLPDDTVFLVDVSGALRPWPATRSS